MSLTWFTGAREPDRPDARAFLEVMRDSDRWGWHAHGLSPDDTNFMDWGNVLVLMIDVPWVGAGFKVLQVGYSASTAECGWGNQYVLDGFADGTDIEEPSLTPSQVAERVAVWLVDQLERPVERRDWCSKSGTVAASAWRLSDTDTELGSRGSWWRRALTRPTAARQVGL